jgi:dTMP kinase
MSKNHKLIVIEGIDGVGKTTLCRELKSALLNQGQSVIWFEEIENPDSIFNSMKKNIKKTVSLETQFYFYLASAINKSETIFSLLENHSVICDRYIYSTYAYHVAKGMSVTNMPPMSILPVRLPDLCYQLVLDESERQQRIRNRKNNDIDDFEIKIPESHIDKFERYLFSCNLPILNSILSQNELVNLILKDFGKA